MTKRFVRLIPIFLFCGIESRVQAQDAVRPDFEVASVKVSPSDSRGGRFAALPGGRLSVRNNPLRNLILNAYDVRNFQILGLPAWVDSDHYDIDAKASGSPAEAQMMQMLQSLLADRFKLKVYYETKELPVFVLTAAKGGIKLQPWKEGSCIAYEAGQPLPAPAPGQEALKPCGNNLVFRKGPNMEWNATKIDMPKPTMVLSSILARTVIDGTGFAGTFDLHLEWSNDENAAAAPKAAESGDIGKPVSAADTDGQSIITVLQQQLGLKLESTKGPVQVLVVEHVEKPSAN